MTNTPHPTHSADYVRLLQRIATQKCVHDVFAEVGIKYDGFCAPCWARQRIDGREWHGGGLEVTEHFDGVVTDD